MIKQGLIDSKGNILRRGILPTEPHIGLDPFLRKIAEIIDGYNAFSPQGIAVSVPGVVNPYTGDILGGIPNIPFLHGENLKEHLEGTHSLPVTVINDVKAAALGEYWVGVARGCKSLLCVTVGTGIGGCLMLDGNVYEGAHFRAGELGFMRYKSNTDFMEIDCSAKGLILAAQRELNDDKLTAEMFFTAVQQGHVRSSEIFHAWLDKLGSALADALILTDPEMLVIGGGVTENGDLLLLPLQDTIRRHLPAEFAFQCKIKLASCGNDSGMLGAVCHLRTRANVQRLCSN